MSAGDPLSFLVFGARHPWRRETTERAFGKVAVNGLLGLQPFHVLVTQFYKLPLPEADSLLTRRLFALFLGSHAEEITLAELLAGLTILSSSDRAAKLQLAFKAYDFEDTGLIMLRNIETVSRHVCDFLFSSPQPRNPWARFSRMLSDTYPRFCLPSHTLGTAEFVAMASAGHTDFANLLSLFSEEPLSSSASSSSSPSRKSSSSSSSSSSFSSSSSSSSSSAKPRASQTAAGSLSAPQSPVTEGELTELEAKLVAKVRALQSELRSQLAAGQEKDAQIQALQERNALLEKNQKAQATRIADMAARTEKTFLELSKEMESAQSQLEVVLQWMVCPDDSESDFAPAHDSSVIKVGFMLKEGEIMRRWKRRLFVLRSNGDLIWYTQKQKPRARGSLSLRTQVLRKVRSEDDVQRHILELVTPDKKMQLLFKDAATMDDWAVSFISVEAKKKPPAPAQASSS